MNREEEPIKLGFCPDVLTCDSELGILNCYDERHTNCFYFLNRQKQDRAEATA